jgi:hypothetical protein
VFATQGLVQRRIVAASFRITGGTDKGLGQTLQHNSRVLKTEFFSTLVGDDAEANTTERSLFVYVEVTKLFQ